jgi:DNA-binding NarL/FixJ family response regulator
MDRSRFEPFVMAYRVLLVDTDPTALAASKRTFSADGYLVASAEQYDDARRRLELAAPDLLVVDVRLGAHNGLQLVIRAHHDYPQVAAIVTHVMADSVLEKDALAAGAAFLVKPIPAERLLDAARVQLAGRPPVLTTEIPRRWPRKMVSVGGVLGNRQIRVIDLSYGGLCLEVADVPDPRWTRGDQLTLSPVGRVPVRVVWSRKASVSGRPGWVCGAEVLMTQQPRRHESWRYFVDSVA